MRAPSRTHERAKHLRRKLSLPEVLLWVRLRGRESGLPSFRRQHPVGPYVLDFYCSAARLCVEVDGYSHLTEDRPERDVRRDAYLLSLGIRVIRYAAATVLADPDAISASILETVDELAAKAPPP